MKTCTFKVVVEPDEVVQMIVDELQEEGAPLPTGDDVEVFDETRVAVTV